ncbi:uncharacterized protein TNCV_1851291 [Trichonephila clavipes]|nr:uncharacterized protein TNCV_1851291 [Trichonephila clavipes]
MIVAELQQKVNLTASSNMVLILQNWSFRCKYSQDKSEMGKLAWRLTDFIKRDDTVKIRRSSRENRMIRQRFRFKLKTHDNIYRDEKSRPANSEASFGIASAPKLNSTMTYPLSKGHHRLPPGWTTHPQANAFKYSLILGEIQIDNPIIRAQTMFTYPHPKLKYAYATAKWQIPLKPP